jgi:hypothetical protein
LFGVAMPSVTTLAIDFGSKYIGIALVRTEGTTNTPLLAGTIKYDRYSLSKKTEPRVQLRRLRRTRKTKKARLRRLEHGLVALGLETHTVNYLLNFCKRRGYKSLFDESRELGAIDKDEEETVFRFSREEFFKALEKELSACLPEEKRSQTLALCEHVLNRDGDRFKEVRLIRFDNRGSSRCAWDGCNCVSPRRDNALRDALAQFVFTVYAQRLREDQDLLGQFNVMLDKLEKLGKRLRNINGADPKAERKALLKKIGEELKLLKGLVGVDPGTEEGESNSGEAWTHIRRNLMNLLEKSGGRNRFCRGHSAEYIQHLLSGTQIPFKRTMTEKDLVSRREEILLQKLWRYIEARVLPLAPQGINRVVVERAAFDILAGTMKQRQEVMNSDYLEEMYQQGPRYGFKGDLEMFKAEFAGRCAYCGKPCQEMMESEHILPQADFFFDSYLNKVPACIPCNRQKSKLAPGAAGMKIHEDAYLAYEHYLKEKFHSKPPHLFHTIKKGILKLLTNRERVYEAERLLSLIAENLGHIVETQRGPRPLARFLSEKLRKHSGRIPEVAFRNGRHVMLWRRAAYPEFDKAGEKATGGIVNHALDALLMASVLPDPKVLEARHLPPWIISGWADKVRAAAPQAGPKGLPQMPNPTSAVTVFETVLPGNFIETDLGLLNWNRKDSGVQRQGAYGWDDRRDMPVQRTSAAGMADTLRKADKKKTPAERQGEVKKEVAVVVHPHLRPELEKANVGEKPGEATAAALTAWLRKAIKGNLKKTQFSPHPADQERAKALQEFVAGSTDIIPPVIGIRVYCPNTKANTDLIRVQTHSDRPIHHYVADPANRGIIVAYAGRDGKVQRDKPLTLELRQSRAVIPGVKALGEVPPGPLQGRAFGQPRIDQDEWTKALHSYLQAAGVMEYTLVTQGCVVRYEDGSEKYIRNFSSSYGFKKSLLKGIIATKHSPLTKKVAANIEL